MFQVDLNQDNRIHSFPLMKIATGVIIGRLEIKIPICFWGVTFSSVFNSVYSDHSREVQPEKSCPILDGGHSLWSPLTVKIM